MSEKCEAIIGFLVPRTGCNNLADTKCTKCNRKICHEHSIIKPSGVYCTSCGAPDKIVQKLDRDIYFTNEDIDNFASLDKEDSDVWLDFT